MMMNDSLPPRRDTRSSISLSWHDLHQTLSNWKGGVIYKGLSENILCAQIYGTVPASFIKLRLWLDLLILNYKWLSAQKPVVVGCSSITIVLLEPSASFHWSSNTLFVFETKTKISGFILLVWRLEIYSSSKQYFHKLEGK